MALSAGRWPRGEMMMHEPQVLRQLSPELLALLGIREFGYVRPVTVGGAPAYAIHAADGSRLGQAPDRTAAVAALQRYDLVPVSVH
jgi:hypothetical protein